MSSSAQSPLGRASAYADRYDASLLFPMPRAAKRTELGIAAAQALPFSGADLWTAFELSWLNSRGKPHVALAHFTVPCETTNIIESKSLKLYLNSFNNTRFADLAAVEACLRTDLTEAVWRSTDATRTGSAGDADEARARAVPPTPLGLRVVLPELFEREAAQELQGLSLDRLDVDCTHFTPAPQLLKADQAEAPVSEVLTSNLLKSNCLVTGQPDWGSVQVSYTGAPIEQAGLLQYLVSFRNHNEFHEPCVERIFMDIWSRCRPLKLSVYARYTRRGGLDINPFRASFPQALPDNKRTARQ